LRQIVDFVEKNLGRLETLTEACRVQLGYAFSSENGQGGTTLDHSLLSRLGNLPFELTLDLYPPGPITPED
jgi:hypothetical protein